MWPFSGWSEAALIRDTVTFKREQRAEAIAAGLAEANAVSPVPAEDDIEYLAADASTIAAHVRSKKWTSRRVMEAYVRSAARAHSRTNCLTEVMFVQALDHATQLDKQTENASAQELEGRLLLGVPVSIKDQIDYPGVDTSRGFARYCKQPADEAAAIVDVLQDAGAIVFCKTNVPQTMLAFECSNPTFGRTLNPYSANHTAGGSSGGEAALLALDGSALGIGSDIGGSLRIPAGYSGCFSIKPVAGRFPTRGVRGVVPGYEAIRTTLGPMGRSVKDIELCMRVVADASERIGAGHHGLMPMPFKEVDIPKTLRIGYVTDDNLLPVSPACVRAVNETIAAARAAGNECVPVQLPSSIEALEIFQALGSSDAYRTLTSHLYSREPRESALFLPVLGARLPSWVRSFAGWLLRTVAGEHMFARILGASGEKRTSDVWKWQAKRDIFAARVKRLLWEELKLDALVCPVQAVPAVSHGATKRLSPLAVATIYWNVVDSTVGTLPITRVDATLDALPADHAETIVAKAGLKLLTRELYKNVYDPVKMAGLPVGVQVVGPAWQEERVLKVMEVINEAVEVKQGGPAFGPGLKQEKA